MASTTICDKCGCIIPPGDTSMFYLKRKILYTKIRYATHRDNAKTSYYDLCPECGKILEEWLESKQ